MVHTIEHVVPEKKGFYPIWQYMGIVAILVLFVWFGSWSHDQDYLNKHLFPHSKESSYEIRVQGFRDVLKC